MKKTAWSWFLAAGIVFSTGWFYCRTHPMLPMVTNCAEPIDANGVCDGSCHRDRDLRMNLAVLTSGVLILNGFLVTAKRQKEITADLASSNRGRG